MKRRIHLALASTVVLLLVLGLAAIVPRAGTFAQEASPPAEDLSGAGGLAFEPLAGGVVAELPQSPALFSLSRVTVEPGASLPIPAEDPSVGLIRVESGELTVRLEAPAQVLRGSGPGMVEETVPAGTEFTLAPGDSTLLPAHVAGEIRNDSSTPVIVLAAFVEPVPAS